MITKAQQDVADIAAAGPDGFGARVEAHANRLRNEGDLTALADFTNALVLFSRVCREVSEEQSR